MLKPTEREELAPYVHQRVIKWADTDSGQIAYTVRFFDFSMDAIEGWFRAVLDIDWYRLNLDLHLGTPFVHVDMDILAPLTPRNSLNTAVWVDKLGHSSLTFRVEGERSDGVASFRGRFVCVMVNNQIMKSVTIPDDFRRRIIDYQAACADATACTSSLPTQTA